MVLGWTPSLGPQKGAGRGSSSLGEHGVSVDSLATDRSEETGLWGAKSGSGNQGWLEYSSCKKGALKTLTPQALMFLDLRAPCPRLQAISPAPIHIPHLLCGTLCSGLGVICLLDRTSLRSWICTPSSAQYGAWPAQVSLQNGCLTGMGDWPCTDSVVKTESFSSSSSR